MLHVTDLSVYRASFVLSAAVSISYVFFVLCADSELLFTVVLCKSQVIAVPAQSSSSSHITDFTASRVFLKKKNFFDAPAHLHAFVQRRHSGQHRPSRPPHPSVPLQSCAGARRNSVGREQHDSRGLLRGTWARARRPNWFRSHPRPGTVIGAARFGPHTN
jgi:hypothetical protein